MMGMGLQVSVGQKKTYLSEILVWDADRHPQQSPLRTCLCSQFLSLFQAPPECPRILTMICYWKMQDSPGSCFPDTSDLADPCADVPMSAHLSFRSFLSPFLLHSSNFLSESKWYLLLFSSSCVCFNYVIHMSLSWLIRRPVSQTTWSWYQGLGYCNDRPDHVFVWRNLDFGPLGYESSGMI